MTSRGLTFGLLGMMLAAGPGSTRAQDGPPALLPPVLEAPATNPAQKPEAKPAVKPETKPANPSLLLIPGVTAPAPPRRDLRTPRPEIERAPFVAAPDAAPAPAPARPAGPSTRPAPNILTLEPIIEDVDDEPAEAAPPRGARPATAPSTAQPGRPAPNRASPNLLGRFLGPAGAANDGGPGSAITVEPRSDPAADAAVKRRIEKQIEQTLGNRVRTVEVRVTGRSVLLRAKAARFWQKRSIRQSLETLPLPAGYRSRVEMMD